MKDDVAVRWALVTFGGCLTSGAVGHTSSDDLLAIFVVAAISVIFAMVGVFTGNREEVNRE